MNKKTVAIIEFIKNIYPDYSKDKILSLILCKNVYINGELFTDPKAKINADSELKFKFDKFVSRGGYKLEKALKYFNIDVKDKVILDAGSSTGGFTDCLLQNGAKLVHSVDVGYNQIDYSLRIDHRVILHEKTNIMALDKLNPVPDFAVSDLSFRSIRKAGRHILDLTSGHLAVSLIKPQFEIPHEVPYLEYNFNGVIKSEELLYKTMESVYDILAEDNVAVLGITSSPIKGLKGNKEYLVLLSYKNSVACSLSKEQYMSLLYET